MNLDGTNGQFLRIAIVMAWPIIRNYTYKSNISMITNWFWDQTIFYRLKTSGVEPTIKFSPFR